MRSFLRQRCQPPRAPLSKFSQQAATAPAFISEMALFSLLRTSSDGLGIAKLACHAVKVGDPIVAYGNPLKIEFVAAYGKIAGEPRETGPWKSVYVTDITTVMGQSGGGTFADNGDLIGITVGVMAAQVGLSGSLVGYGFVVPSADICGLLARK